MSYLVGNPAPRAPMFDAVGAVLSFLRERGVASERDVLRALAESNERHAERHGLRPPVGKPLAAVRLLLALENRGRIVRTVEGGATFYAAPEEGS